MYQQLNGKRPAPALIATGQGAQGDTKKIRKAIQRRTIDFNALVIRQISQRGKLKGNPVIQPDPNFIYNLLPPYAYQSEPITSVPLKFIHSSVNKIRCPIHAAKWTPEGRRLITGASSGEFTLWNGLTFNFETILQAHDRAIRTIKWAHNGAYMLTGDDGGVIKYWQPNMNNLKAIQAHKECVREISFSPTDSKFASASDDGTIRLWSFEEAKEERILTGHGWDVRCIDWHPSKGLLASGAKDNLIKIWDPKSGKALATLHGHSNTILGLQWNQNGNWLLSGARDQLIKMFDIRMMKELQTFRGHKREVFSVSWHPIHETLFASGGYEGSMHFWFVGTNSPFRSMENAHDGAIYSLDWHPLGHILVSGSHDHATRFWTRSRPGERSEEDSVMKDEVAEEEPESLLPGLGKKPAAPISIPGLDRNIPGIGGYQHVTLVGNVGKEPTFTEFQNPKGSVKGRYRFPLATVKLIKDATGETVQKVTWHNITTVDPLAEQYIKTGNKVLIEGEIVYWKTDATNGVNINASKIVTLSRSGAKVESAGNEASSNQAKE